MKQFLLTCLAAMAIASTLFAGDHVEVGSVTTHHGAYVIATYLVVNGAYREVDLVWPDGHVDQIAITPGTPIKTMKVGIQRFVNKQ